MKWALCLALVLASFVSFANEPPTNRAATNDERSRKFAHSWVEILFDKENGGPQFSIPGGESTMTDLKALRLDIADIPVGMHFFRTNKITARLYRANGEIVEPTDEGKQWLTEPIEIQEGIPPFPGPSVFTLFPWGPNILETCWAEVSIGAERYWVEIPYGFDRNPADPLADPIPSSNSNDGPKPIAAMKLLNSHDHIVRWKSVEYIVGHIHDGWWLEIYQSNPQTGICEAVLNRDDPATGEAMRLRDLQSPITSIDAVDNDGDGVTSSQRMELRLHNDSDRLSDIFSFYGNPNYGRGWGHIEISAGNKTYRVLVPTSLYKNGRGHDKQILNAD
jgi:hypothetical protein